MKKNTIRLCIIALVFITFACSNSSQETGKQQEPGIYVIDNDETVEDIFEVRDSSKPKLKNIDRLEEPSGTID